MSTIPKHRPAINPDVARMTAYRLLLADRQCEPYQIMVRCPVMMLAIRRPGVGTYDDDLLLIDGWSGPVRQFNGNTDPSRFGASPMGNGKDEARLEPGNWFFIRGHHNALPRCFRQPDAAQAAAAGLLKSFRDPVRSVGHFTVRRMHSATEGKLDTGLFNVNLHPGGNHGTSSAGCQTMPPAQYDEMRDAAYAAMDASGQPFLPYLLTTVEAFATSIA